MTKNSGVTAPYAISRRLLTCQPVSLNLTLECGRKCGRMARLIRRLTELQVQRAKRGWHNDGGGLYLRVDVSKDGKGRKSRWWVYRYGAGGKRYHGLGPANTV